MPANVTSPGTPGTATGTPVLSSNALPIGTRILEFEITRVIGEGGFSVVYLAFDHTLHRSIALKEYIPSALASRRGDLTVAVRSAQHQQTFEAGLRSFINEARLLAQFDHPALVKVFRFWEANGTAYMAMPYYEGRTLKEILRQHPEQAGEAWLKRLLVPLLDALALLHAHRCYHRDIAPDNIQVLDNEQPVLLDFGAARRTIGDMTQAFTVILKPGYAPIEQYAEETDLRQGPWTDVYALAAVLYGAIVGKPPPTAVARVIKDPLEPLASRNIAGFDATFLSGIDRGLAVRPEARPQSIAEWRGLLGMDESLVRAGDASALASRGGPPEAHAAGGKAGDASMTREAAKAGEDAAANDGEAEADRTILVPGLRRPTAAPASALAEQPSGAKESATATRATDGTTTKRAKKAMAATAGVIALVAVVAWLAIAPPSGHVEQAPPAAAAKVEPPPAQASAAAAPKVEPSRAPPATVAKAEPAPSPAPIVAAPKAEPAPVAPTPVPAARPPAAQAPSEATARAAAPVPAAEAAPEKPATPVISEDERRWAALRNSDDVDELRAFRHRYPQSRHAQEAAVRIQQLVRQSRENTREASAAPVAKSAPAPSVAKTAPAPSIAKADEAPRSPRAGSAERASPAPAASTGTVRIRVQPFGYVYVDGALVGPSPPARDVQLAPGRHQIEARNDQENPPVVRKEVNVTGPGSTEVPLRFGQ